MKNGNYKMLALTLVLSFIIMYAVMYLNVDRFDHIYLNMTRFYMTVLMICPMALLMLAMMRMMYTDKRLNMIITVCSVVIFILALAGVRTQAGIGDVQYMKGMIPHHSIAILTSKHADIKDPEVRKLADGIIAAQEKEIAEMKQILKRMDK
jgi:uncharacterized protein (DUF305 family)